LWGKDAFYNTLHLEFQRVGTYGVVSISMVGDKMQISNFLTYCILAVARSERLELVECEQLTIAINFLYTMYFFCLNQCIVELMLF
jgi:hypothetical protein